MRKVSDNHPEAVQNDRASTVESTRSCEAQPPTITLVGHRGL